jgi:hypothetical protein
MRRYATILIVLSAAIITVRAVAEDDDGPVFIDEPAGAFILLDDVHHPATMPTTVPASHPTSRPSR